MYFPRRYPSEELSLEYLIVYDNNASDKTIALIAGIYESESEAKNVLSKIKKYRSNSFIVNTDLYLGCIH